jgi:hypothetical protein
VGPALAICISALLISRSFFCSPAAFKASLRGPYPSVDELNDSGFASFLQPGARLAENTTTQITFKSL